MQTTPAKSPKIANRIKTINFDLASYRDSIKLILEVIEKNRIIKSTPFAPRIIKYSCIPRSEKRFQETLQRLKVQVKILETELETLNKYA